MEIKDFTFTNSGITIGYTGGGEPGPTPPGPTPVTDRGISFDIAENCMLFGWDEQAQGYNITFARYDDFLSDCFSKYVEDIATPSGSRTGRDAYLIDVLNITYADNVSETFDVTDYFMNNSNSIVQAQLPYLNVKGLSNIKYLSQRGDYSLNTMEIGMTSMGDYFEGGLIKESTINFNLTNCEFISNVIISTVNNNLYGVVFGLVAFNSEGEPEGWAALDEDSDYYKFWMENFSIDTVSYLNSYKELYGEGSTGFMNWMNVTSGAGILNAKNINYSLPKCQVIYDVQWDNPEYYYSTSDSFSYSEALTSIYLENIKFIHAAKWPYKCDLYLNVSGEIKVDEYNYGGKYFSGNLYVPESLIGYYVNAFSRATVFSYNFDESMPF